MERKYSVSAATLAVQTRILIQAPEKYEPQMSNQKKNNDMNVNSC